MESARLRILVVDDEPAMRAVLETRLRHWGGEVRVAGSAAEALAAAEEFRPHVVLADVVLPDASGPDLLADLLAGDPQRMVIMMTAFGAIDQAVETMKRGARDFLTKPLDYPALTALLEAGAREIEMRREVGRLESALDQGAGLGPLVGRSAGQRELYGLIETVAANDAAVIITGESGTGKELVARTIHALSRRKEGPFVAVNVAAIPEGLTEAEIFGHEKGAFTGAVAARPGIFEQAHRGTLFLDELIEMAPLLQPKFLRVLEGGSLRRLGSQAETAFDVRVIAATNRDPAAAMEQGLLRNDLYYRLSVFTLSLLPLRERREDLPLLAQHFIRESNEKHGMSVVGLRPEALDLLAGHPWPGNVRELRNVIERAVILAREQWIQTHHLPPLLRQAERQPAAAIVLPSGMTLAEAERVVILETIGQTRNNKTEAARRLDIDVKTLRNKLRSFGWPGRRR